MRKIAGVIFIIALLLLTSCGHGITDSIPEQESTTTHDDIDMRQKTEDAQNIELQVGIVEGFCDNFESLASLYEKTQDKYTVACKIYESAGLLNLALLSGEVDIVASCDLLTMRNYASKEILLPLEEAVPSLFEEGYLLKNVVDATRLNDDCYFLPRQFDISGYTLPTKYMDGKDSFESMDELVAQINKTDPKMVKKNLKADIIYYAILDNFDEWVDWDNRKARFDEPSFKNILKLASMASLDEDEQSGYWHYPEGMEYVMPDCLEHKSINSNLNVYRIRMPDQMRNAPEYVIFPLPLEHIHGFAIRADEIIGIARGSKHPEGAKDFYRFMFESGAVLDTGFDGMYLPTRTDLAREELRLDTDNLYIEDIIKEETWRIVLAGDHLSYKMESELLMAVMDEADDCLKGLISEDKAIHNIQNRVQIYLDEQG